MKKLLSILCAFTLILSVVLVPGMFSASAATVDLAFNIVKYNANVTEADGVYSISKDWQDGFLYTDYVLDATKTYNLTFNTNVDNYGGLGVKVMATTDPTAATISSSAVVDLPYAKGNKNIDTIRPSVNFKASDIVDGDKKYLGIKFISADSAKTSIKNIVLREVPTDDYVDLIGKAEHGYIGVDEEGYNAFITVPYYGRQYGTYNYEIEPDATYKIDCEFKGKTWSSDNKPLAWTTSSETTPADSAISATRVNLPVQGGTNYTSYTPCSITVKGSELGANGVQKYLSIAGNSVTSGVQCYVRKVTVTRIVVDDSFDYPVVIGPKVNKTSVDNTYVYEAAGQYFGLWYAFDKVIEADKDYEISYEFKGHTYNIGQPFALCVADTANLGSGEHPANTAYTKSDIKLQTASSKGKWTPFKTLFKGSDILNAEKANQNKLMIYGHGYEVGADLPCFRYFKIKEVEPLEFADYTEVDKAIAEVNKLNKDDYVSFENVTKAVNAVARNLLKAEQARVDAMAKAINDAVKALVKITPLVDDGYLKPEKMGARSSAIGADFNQYSVIGQYYGFWFAFANEIDPNAYYRLSYDFMGHTYNIGTRIGIYAANIDNLNVKGEHLTAGAYNENRVNLNLVSSKKKWTSLSTVFKGSDILDPTNPNNNQLLIYGGGYEVGEDYPTLRKIKLETIVSPVKSEGIMVQVENGDVVYTSSESGGKYGAWMNFNYVLEPDTYYVFTYEYKGSNKTSGTELSLGCVADAAASQNPESVVPAGKRVEGLHLANSTSTFTKKSVVFNSNEIINGGAATLCIFGSGYDEAWAIKNINIKKRDALLLVNGNFDDASLGKSGWSDSDGIATRVTTENHTTGGNGALNIKGNAFEQISQSATVDKNTNYELSFWYKGKVGDNAFVSVFRNVVSSTKDNLFLFAALKDTDEWTQYKTVINSGNNDLFAVAFNSGMNSNFYLDDIVLRYTEEEATVDASKKFTEGSNLDTESVLRYWHYDAPEGDNLVPNYDFEGDATAWQDFIDLSNGAASIVDGEGYAGNNKDTEGKALKFSAVGTETEESYIWFDVKPNTEYLLSLYTRTPSWSPENTADIRWGMANGYNGDLIYSFRQDVRGYKIVCNDNMWHRTTALVNSGDNTRLGFGIKAANSTMYVDNIQFFENVKSEWVDGRPEIVKDNMYKERWPFVTNDAPTKIYVSDDKNLVKNGDFSDSDISFWNEENAKGFKGQAKKDGYLTLLDWEGTADIKDTNTSYGKALHYVENADITGMPLATNYLKFFDVEPNTEYTFVANYLVTKSGTGTFGLAAGNSYQPIKFGNELTLSKVYDPNLKWQKVSFTFNTNVFEQVVLYIFDFGGEVYLDNISLFKASDGSATPVEDTPEVVEGKIESNKYNVVEDTLTGVANQKLIEGVTAGTTISEILNTLSNKNSVKVFDATGKEITDYTKAVGSGTTFRFMDGISALDSAVVLIRGDVNGDGLVNGDDMRILMKTMFLTYYMDDIEMLVADIDEDGMITSNDVALISAHIGGAKALEPVTVG